MDDNRIKDLYNLPLLDLVMGLTSCDILMWHHFNPYMLWAESMNPYLTSTQKVFIFTLKFFVAKYGNIQNCSNYFLCSAITAVYKYDINFLRCKWYHTVLCIIHLLEFIFRTLMMWIWYGILMNQIKLCWPSYFVIFATTIGYFYELCISFHPVLIIVL